MTFKVHYTPKQLTTRRPFFGTGWPVRNPSKTCLTEQSEYRRQRYVWLACTQLPQPYTAADQKRIVQEWCEFLQNESPIRELALRSRTSQKLFEAVCHQQQLERLHIKWGPVSNLAPLERLQRLEGLSLGTTGVEDISVISRLPRLKLLQLNDLKRVHDFEMLSKAINLEFLQIEGYWPGPRKIHVKDLGFARTLHRLRALSLSCVLIDDFDLSPLLELQNLEYLELPTVPEEDRQRLLAALPKLRHGNVVCPREE